MKILVRLMPLAVAAVALAAVASPAQATQNIVITGTSGTFGNDGVAPAGSPTASFTNTFTFGSGVVTGPGGFLNADMTGLTLANATLSTSALGGNNIDFTSAFLNGVGFTLSPTGTFEFGSVGPVTLQAINTLTINGFDTSDGSFAGTLTFSAAVPEPATWGMMLLGFGVMGASLRRRRRSLPQLAQAV